MDSLNRAKRLLSGSSEGRSRDDTGTKENSVSTVTEPVRDDIGTNPLTKNEITGSTRNVTGTNQSDTEPEPVQNRNGTGISLERLFRIDRQTKKRGGKNRTETQFSDDEIAKLDAICAAYGESRAAVIRIAVSLTHLEFEKKVNGHA